MRTFFHRVGRRPVARVGVGEETSLRDQSHECTFNEIFALEQVIEDLRPEREVAAVLPLTQVTHGCYLCDQPAAIDIDHMMRGLRWHREQTRHGITGFESRDYIGQRCIRKHVRVISQEHRFSLDVPPNPAKPFADRGVQAGINEGDSPVRDVGAE